MPIKRRPQACKVCRHAERYQLELLAAGGASCKSLAEKFGLPHKSVLNHWNHHVTDGEKARYIAGPVLLHEVAGRAAKEGLSLLDYLTIVRSTLMTHFMACAEGGDRQGTTRAAGRLLQCLSEIGRLTGELTQLSSTTINTLIVNSPAFANFQSVILRALGPPCSSS